MQPHRVAWIRSSKVPAKQDYAAIVEEIMQFVTPIQRLLGYNPDLKLSRLDWTVTQLNPNIRKPWHVRWNRSGENALRECQTEERPGESWLFELQRCCNILYRFSKKGKLLRNSNYKPLVNLWEVLVLQRQPQKIAIANTPFALITSDGSDMHLKKKGANFFEVSCSAVPS